VKRVLRFLGRSIPADPHLWVAFVAVFVFLVMDALHSFGWLPWELPPTGLLIVITICLTMLLADRLKEGDETKQEAQKLSRVYECVLEKSAGLRHRPSTREEYDYLWGGFTGKYYVYNPSYRVDTYAGEEEIVKIFLFRYQNPAFEGARYIFLTQEAAGQADLETFRRLMARVRQQYPQVTKKIHVKQLKNKKAPSEAEMYVGIRDGKRIGVMELKEPTLDPQHGMPDYYLVIHDQEMLEHYLRDHFELAWMDANAVDIAGFWS